MTFLYKAATLGVATGFAGIAYHLWSNPKIPDQFTKFQTVTDPKESVDICFERSLSQKDLRGFAKTPHTTIKAKLIRDSERESKSCKLVKEMARRFPKHADKMTCRNFHYKRHPVFTATDVLNVTFVSMGLYHEPLASQLLLTDEKGHLHQVIADRNRFEVKQ